MDRKELPIPEEYLKDVEDIHEEMLKVFSEDISTIPGEFAYDSTRGAAEQIAMLREMMLHFVLMRAFTDTSSGEYLEMIGDMNAVDINQATSSVGRIIFTGKDGTIIPKDTIVATEGTEQVESIHFKILDTVEIKDGKAVVLAECLEKGVIGNVKADSIKVLTDEIEGIKTVSNEEFENGTDRETEEHFRDRVKEAEREDHLSGADCDYERWAKEVDGVGYSYCRECWNGPGTVKVLILDKNRKRASQELINKVKDYIWPDIKPGKRNRGGKAPTGIKDCTISTPDIKEITITGNIKLTKDFDKNLVAENIKREINKYLDKIDIEGTVSYNMIHSIIGMFLVNGEGIDDYNNIKVNGGTSDIKLNSEVASVTEVNATWL